MKVMKAAVLHGKNDIRVEEIPIPELKSDEVLVKVKATGICGSDLPRVLGDEAHFYPIVLGHEFSGVVEKIGENVTKIKVGDRVAGAPLVPCHQCDECRQGYFAQCKNYAFIGSRIYGSWAEYVKLPEINVVIIEDQVTFEEAALFEPSTVALHALRHIGYQGGEDVAILGGGNIGLLVLQWAKILGARSVTVFDIDNDKLALAKKLGADHIINTLDPNFKAESMSITRGKGFGVVMETAGTQVTMNLSFEMAGNKAKVCFIGTPTKDVHFNFKLFELMNRKEFTLTGSWMSYSAPYPGKEWGITADFLAKQLLDFKGLIFKKFPLAQINEAFDLFKIPGAVKSKILLIND
jgi:L-iditol 2-dehydrogenase